MAKAAAARWPEFAILIVSRVAWPGERQMPIGARCLRVPFALEGLAKALHTLRKARGIGF